MILSDKLKPFHFVFCFFKLFSVMPANEELIATLQSNKTPKPSADEVYFNRKAFLTVSGQLHLEAMCQRLGAVYNFGPAFRYESI